MEKPEFIDFDTIRSSLAFHDTTLFSMYLKEVYNDLVGRTELNEGKGVLRNNFYEYMKLPVFISDKLFFSFDLDGDGLLNLKEFSYGLHTLFQGNFEETAQVIFNLFDYDKDGVINKGDVKLLLSYLPLKMLSDKSEYNYQMESLQELDEILKLSFGIDKNSMNFREFLQVIEHVKSDIYLQILCFLYQKKPFQENKINLFKNHRKKAMSDSITSAKKKITTISKIKTNQKRLPSPSKKSNFSSTADYLNMTLLRSCSPQKETNKILDSFTPLKSININTNTTGKHIKKASFDINKEVIRMSNQKIIQEKKDNDVFTFQNLPNMLKTTQNYFDSPSLYLKKGTSRKASGVVTSFKLDENDKEKEDIENIVKLKSETENDVTNEDWIYKYSSNDKKIKKYYMVLMGKEIYLYNSKNKDDLVIFHNLSGCFIKDEEGYKLIDKEKYYWFNIIFSKTVTKNYYLKDEDTKNIWVEKIKKAIGYQNFKDHYDILSDIGEGKFGVVKLGIHKETGLQVAVKMIKKEQLSPYEVELVRTEIDLMKLLKHPNMVRLLDHFENVDYIIIVMEYLAGGNLIKYINTNGGRLNEIQTKKIIYNIAKGIQYMNSYGIIHRDLKPENIMLTEDTKSLNIKIIDFGLTKTLAPGERIADGFGTITYVAPEVYTRKPYNKQIDIWSIGIMLYVMLSGLLPFYGDSDEDIGKKTVYLDPDFPNDGFGGVSKDAIRLILQCLEKDPERRITIEKLLKNEWLSDCI